MGVEVGSLNHVDQTLVLDKGQYQMLQKVVPTHTFCGPDSALVYSNIKSGVTAPKSTM